MDRTIEGKAYINKKFQKCCIGIKEGKISTIKKILNGDQHLDFGSKLILPSGIDIHVHFRDPGFVHKEDFKTGSLAAAFGGITCVFDMPNTRPQTTSVNSILEKKRIAENKSFIDFGIYAAISNNNIESITELSKKCSGFKIFLGSSTNSLQLSEQNLNDVLQKVNQSNKIALIHAENEPCLKKYNAIEHNLKDHLKCRPSECEEISIKNILNICKNISSKIHICHLSSCDGFEVLKNRPKNISAGVTPPHLFFDINNVKTNQSFYKVNPPIRLSYDRETLWYGLKNGFIDVLESDHAPHAIEEKEVDFNMAPSGIPGVETMFPLLLAEVKKEQLSFDRLISLMCEKPAELMGMPKGKIEVGRDADLIVVDFKEMHTISADKLHSKCGWTPFENMNGIFPSHVFVRGEKLIEEHELQGRQGFGKYIGV